MSTVLACTWRPRGERIRLQRIYPQLRRVYEHIVVSVPSDVGSEEMKLLQEQLELSVVVASQVGWGRYLAIQEALEASTNHVHYADLDRLLHWIEVQPVEWQQTIETIKKTDCLIIGRTGKACQTHPQAILQTEQLINVVVSKLLGQLVDVGGGTRGFSRQAVQFLMSHSSAGGWGDAEWPILLHRAGFKVDYVAVDGLEWETPDHYREQMADADLQNHVTEGYDKEAANWAVRVQIALEIIQEGLAAVEQPLKAFQE